MVVVFVVSISMEATISVLNPLVRSTQSLTAYTIGILNSRAHAAEDWR